MIFEDVIRDCAPGPYQGDTQQSGDPGKQEHLERKSGESDEATVMVRSWPFSKTLTESERT